MALTELGAPARVRSWHQQQTLIYVFHSRLKFTDAQAPPNMASLQTTSIALDVRLKIN